MYHPPGVVSRLFGHAGLARPGRPALRRLWRLQLPRQRDSTLDRNLVDVLHRYNLLQHVDTATHVGGNVLDQSTCC